MQLLKHLANAMQRAEGFVLERALVVIVFKYIFTFNQNCHSAHFQKIATVYHDRLLIPLLHFHQPQSDVISYSRSLSIAVFGLCRGIRLAQIIRSGRYAPINATHIKKLLYQSYIGVSSRMKRCIVMQSFSCPSLHPDHLCSNCRISP